MGRLKRWHQFDRILIIEETPSPGLAMAANGLTTFNYAGEVVFRVPMQNTSRNSVPCRWVQRATLRQRSKGGSSPWLGESVYEYE